MCLEILSLIVKLGIPETHRNDDDYDEETGGQQNIAEDKKNKKGSKSPLGKQASR